MRQAVRDAGYAAGHRAEAAEARAERAKDYARDLRAAKRKLSFEQEGFVACRPGFSIGRVGEASERVTQLEGLLAECCLDDPEVIGAARRAVAW